MVSYKLDTFVYILYMYISTFTELSFIYSVHVLLVVSGHLVLRCYILVEILLIKRSHEAYIGKPIFERVLCTEYNFIILTLSLELECTIIPLSLYMIPWT